MIPGIYAGAANGGGVPATWNPADKSSSVTLSDGDKAAAKSALGAAWASVRGLLGRSTTDGGKFYFELDCVAAPGVVDATFGIATAAMALDGPSGGYVGSGAAGVSYGIYQRSGQKATGDVFTSFASDWTLSARLGFHLDMAAGKLWISVNGVHPTGGDPAAGTGETFSGLSGTYFPAASHYDGGSVYLTTAFLTSADFDYSPAAGYSAWQ